MHRNFTSRPRAVNVLLAKARQCMEQAAEAVWTSPLVNAKTDKLTDRKRQMISLYELQPAELKMLTAKTQENEHRNTWNFLCASLQ